MSLFEYIVHSMFFKSQTRLTPHGSQESPWYTSPQFLPRNFDIVPSLIFPHNRVHTVKTTSVGSFLEFQADKHQKDQIINTLSCNGEGRWCLVDNQIVCSQFWFPIKKPRSETNCNTRFLERDGSIERRLIDSITPPNGLGLYQVPTTHRINLS
jgi:hypothetical protein